MYKISKKKALISHIKLRIRLKEQVINSMSINDYKMAYAAQAAIAMSLEQSKIITQS